jgi:uncharacterized protein (TIGR03067 family)
MNLFAALALASFVGAPVPPADELTRAKQNLQGEWAVLEFTRGGRPCEKKELEGAKAVVKGDTFTLAFADRLDETTFTLDLKTTPPTINFAKTDPVFQGRIMSGIFKQEGDKITICCAFEDAEKPKEFKSLSGSRTCLFVLERVKK